MSEPGGSSLLVQVNVPPYSGALTISPVEGSLTIFFSAATAAELTQRAVTIRMRINNNEWIFDTDKEPDEIYPTTRVKHFFNILIMTSFNREWRERFTCSEVNRSFVADPTSATVSPTKAGRNFLIIITPFLKSEKLNNMRSSEQTWKIRYLGSGILFNSTHFLSFPNNPRYECCKNESIVFSFFYSFFLILFFVLYSGYGSNGGWKNLLPFCLTPFF